MASDELHADHRDCSTPVEFDFKMVHHPADYYLCPGGLYYRGSDLCRGGELPDPPDWPDDSGDWDWANPAPDVCGGYADFPTTEDWGCDGSLCPGYYVCPSDWANADWTNFG